MFSDVTIGGAILKRIKISKREYAYTLFIEYMCKKAIKSFKLLYVVDHQTQIHLYTPLQFIYYYDNEHVRWLFNSIYSNSMVYTL